jgi:quercetin dioxygenase-like cupin family protein
MKRHRTRILAAIAGFATVGALIGAARTPEPAQATPSSGVTTTILGKSFFDEINVNARSHQADRWKAQIKTHGRSDVYVVDNKFAPGGTTGWHSHPGPSLILVVAGTVTNYMGDDPGCTPHVYTAGAGFIDPGGGDVHMLRNETGVAAETVAVQLLPNGADRRIDASAPRNCPS